MVNIVTPSTTTLSDGRPVVEQPAQKVYEKKKTIFRTYQIVWYILGVIDVIGLIFGIFFLGKNWKRKEIFWLICWLLLSPIPAALTFDGANHASRLFIFSAPLLIIVGFGWWLLVETLTKNRFTRLLCLALGALVAVNFAYFLHRYLVHYPFDGARYFSYGLKQAMLKINSLESQYKHIAMDTVDPPMIYYLFWSHTPPRYLQEYGTDFSLTTIKNHPLDKYKPMSLNTAGDLEKLASNLRADTLYLTNPTIIGVDFRDPKFIPKDINLIDIIKFPDNEVAYYLLTKKTQ